LFVFSLNIWIIVNYYLRLSKPALFKINIKIFRL